MMSILLLACTRSEVRFSSLAYSRIFNLIQAYFWDFHEKAALVLAGFGNNLSS